MILDFWSLFDQKSKIIRGRVLDDRRHPLTSYSTASTAE
jgi:hypothetical protein